MAKLLAFSSLRKLRNRKGLCMQNDVATRRTHSKCIRMSVHIICKQRNRQTCRHIFYIYVGVCVCVLRSFENYSANTFTLLQRRRCVNKFECETCIYFPFHINCILQQFPVRTAISVSAGLPCFRLIFVCSQLSFAFPTSDLHYFLRRLLFLLLLLQYFCTIHACVCVRISVHFATMCTAQSTTYS